MQSANFAYYLVGSKNDIPYKTRGLCSIQNINLIYIHKISDLLSRIAFTNPPIVFIDSSSVEITTDFLKIFAKDTEYYVPCIVIISDSLREEDYSKELNNCVFCGTNSISETISCCLNSLKNNPDLVGRYCTRINAELIMNYLLSLNFSYKHIGLIYLKEVIKLALANGGNISSLHNDYYPILAQQHNCTVFCVERNIRNAIEAAWKRLDVDEASKTFNTPKSFFEEKPSNRKLIGFLTSFFLEYFNETDKQKQLQIA